MEQDKIIKLLDFLTTDAIIEIDKSGIVIKNYQYETNIKIEGLPDWNYKVEFALRSERNPFKKLGENKGEAFVLPYSIMKVFLENITEELNSQTNKEIIDKQGLAFYKEKTEEIFKILKDNNKIEEEFQSYIISYRTDLFNNVMCLDKFEEDSILNHEFIKLSYTYLIKFEDSNDGRDPSYETQTIKLSIPSIKIEDYPTLLQCFKKPVKNNYDSLMDILKKNNKDDKMNKLLLFTKLEAELEPNQIKMKTKKI